MEHYYAYRIFLNQDENKQLQFQFKDKKQAFLEVLNSIQQKNVIFKDYVEQHMIFNRKEGENIFILQLAKKQNFDKPVLEKGKIEEVIDVQYPYIYLIIHVEKQLILIQKNTSIFQTLDAVKLKLVRFFTERMIEDHVHCNLSEITDHREFWEQVEDLDSVEKVELDYAPPNFFGGKKAADKLVKDVYEETNFQRFKILLQNKLEGLKFDKEVFKEHIQRISQGAGNYLVEGFKDGVRVMINKVSKLHARQDIEDINNETEESLEERFDEIEEINNDENS